jgi:heterodisulfide reductase subunit A
MDLCKSGLPFAQPVFPVRLICSGRIETAMILHAFEKGAEGILLLGCKADGCRYGPGPPQAKKVSESVRGIMHVLGLEPERFKVARYAHDDSRRLGEDLDHFCRELARLPRSPFAGKPEQQHSP